MNRPGALAEQLVVPGDNAWSIPGQAARDLVCVEPLAVIEAAFRRMGDPPIGTALVIGVGSQGLLATLSLVARGTAVLVHDVNPARVALATSLGARALDPDDAAVSVDLVVDTVGTSAAVDVALRHLRDRRDDAGPVAWTRRRSSSRPRRSSGASSSSADR